MRRLSVACCRIDAFEQRGQELLRDAKRCGGGPMARGPALHQRGKPFAFVEKGPEKSFVTRQAQRVGELVECGIVVADAIERHRAQQMQVDPTPIALPWG